MERSQIFDLMGELQLYGMKAAFDEIMTTAVKRQHEPQRIIGDLLTDFARLIGVAEHHVASSVAWLDQAGPDTAAPAAPDHAEVERRVARQEADKYERMMREEPREYWGSQANQDRYREALERSLPPAPSIEEAPSGEGASVVPGAEPAAAPAAAAATAPIPAPKATA
jgi:hypothetical protein